jgi:Cytochrome c oxidase subunit Va
LKVGRFSTIAERNPATQEDPASDSLSSAGIKHKVENKHQYQEYLDELKPLREELGVNLKEDLYPEGSDSPYHNP